MNNGVFTIKACRVNSGLTQGQFAEALGVSTATVLNWEKGRTSPRLTDLKKISDLTGVPLGLIFLP